MSYKVVHFSNNLTDGAGRAAYRLHRALLESGIDSRMMVYRKDFPDETVHGFLKNYVIPGRGRDYRRLVNWGRFIVRKIIRELSLGFIKPLNLFTLNMPFVKLKDIEPHIQGVDVVCLHSIESFLSSGIIKQIHHITKAPIVWNVVDSEPLTGGCHFNDGCLRFTQSCGNCPQLVRSWAGDRSWRILRRKRKDLTGLPIFFAAGSSWAREHILKSALFSGHEIKSIFLSVDGKFKFQIPRDMAREVVGLPGKKKIILFGCFNIDEERKGGRYLVEALKLLAAEQKDPGYCKSIILVTVGGKSGFEKHSLPFKWIDMGKITDDRLMALVFKSTDVYACPSIDDFGPIMINESIVCGTPVVAFRSGVAPDLIIDDSIGYVAAKRDTEDFKKGLSKFINDLPTDEPSSALQHIQKQLEPAYQAAEYIAFFKSLTAYSG